MNKNIRTLLVLAFSVSLFQAPVSFSAAFLSPLKPYLFAVVAGTGLAGAKNLLEKSTEAAPAAVPTIAVVKAAILPLPDKLPTMEVLEKLMAEATPERLKKISDKYLQELIETAKRSNTGLHERLIPAIVKLGGKNPLLPPPTAFSECLSKITSHKYIKPIVNFKTNHPYWTYYILAGFAYTCVYKPLRRLHHINSQINVVTDATNALADAHIAARPQTEHFLNALKNYEPDGWLERGLDVVFGGHVLLASLYSRLPTIRFR